MPMKYNHLQYRNCSAPDQPYELVFHHVSRSEVTLHTHDFMELFWMQSGRCRHLINGEEVELSTNDFGIIMPEDLHGFRWIGERSYRIANLAFYPDVMIDLLKRHSLEKDPFWGLKTDKMRLRRLAVEDGVWLDREFRSLRKRVPSRLALEHFLLTLILKISPAAEGLFDQCPTWLRETCMLMSKPENFRRGPRHFEQLAGRSLAHVSRVLRQSTGKTPVDWITEWRMVYAAEKLSSGNEPIHEIGRNCGFTSLSRFYNVFSQRYGISPSRYRSKTGHAFPVGK